MAMIVTPLPPVRTVKIALARMQTMASPPGIHPRTRARRGHEPVGRLRLGEDVADEREERDRDDDRRVGEALVEHGRRDEAKVVVRRRRDEAARGSRPAAHDGEERHTGQREEDDPAAVKLAKMPRLATLSPVMPRPIFAPVETLPRAGEAFIPASPRSFLVPQIRAGEGPLVELGPGSDAMLPDSTIAMRSRNFSAITRRPNGKMKSAPARAARAFRRPPPGHLGAGVRPRLRRVHALRVDRGLSKWHRPVGAIEPRVPWPAVIQRS